MARTLTYAEWKEENPVSFPPEFEEVCEKMGLDPKQEIDKILQEYYLTYLGNLPSEQKME